MDGEQEAEAAARILLVSQVLERAAGWAAWLKSLCRP